MKKKHTVIALIMALVMAFSMVAQAGFTPKYDVDMPEVPDIKVELSDEVKEAVNNAVQKQIEKMILDKPAVWCAECRTHDKYTFCIITWGKVEGATSYKVEINNNDGTSNTYETTYNILSVNSYKDDFVKSITNESTIRIKAYGDNDTFSPWSDKKNPYVWKI